MSTVSERPPRRQHTDPSEPRPNENGASRQAFSQHTAVRIDAATLARVDSVRARLERPGSNTTRADALRFLVHVALAAIDRGEVTPEDATPNDVRGKRGRARLHG